MKPIQKLKKILALKKIDAYLILKNDIYFSEEVLPHQERLKYITNFTGSAGSAVILMDDIEKSAIFSDGRYKIQIEKEVDYNDFIYINGGPKEIIKFIVSKNKFIKTIGCDPNLISIKEYEILKKNLKKNNITLKKILTNLVDAIWKDKPYIPSSNIHKFENKFSGKKSSDKTTDLIEQIKFYNADGYFLSQPDGLSWLLNIRDHQQKNSPVFRGSALILKNNKIIVFSENKLAKDFFDKAIPQICFYNYTNISKVLITMSNKTFLMDPRFSSIRILDLFKKNKIKSLFINCLVAEAKSIKNVVEQKNAKIAHLNDGLAFLKFWYWFETDKVVQSLTEEDLSKKLLYYRSLSKKFKGNSFPTICAFGNNGAIVHYRYKKNYSKKINTSNLLLIDSGGQYLNGTTDITRTLIIGKPNSEMINNYTYVLKGHLALSNLIFPKGTKGCNIDLLARMYLWRCFKDYDHGTGHGVGFYLNVHEGPVSINKSNNSIIKDGMIISNEPGYYKENKYGIRIENLELVKTIIDKKQPTNFLYFDTLTMVPYEKKLINKKLLSKDEIKQINSYHQSVYKKIGKLLKIGQKDLKKFLFNKTSLL